MPTLVGKQVGSIGFGLMGLTWRTNPPSDVQAFATMKAALDNGCNFWNGGEFYGPPTANSLLLLNRYFTKYPEDVDRVVISIKGGADPETLEPDGSERGIRRSVDACLSQLGDKKKLDFFECGRVDVRVPIEETISVLASYVKEGKLGGIMLSEAKAETIRRAHKVYPIAGVEIELSMWSTECLTNGVAETCAELGIPIIAYSPIGRGILTGQIKTLDDLAPDDMRRLLPRFQPENFEKNLGFVHEVEKLAKQKNCTPAQLAISWVKSRERTYQGLVVIPIPGATTEERVNENSANIDWTEDDEKKIEPSLSQFTVAGARYWKEHEKYLLN